MAELTGNPGGRRCHPSWKLGLQAGAAAALPGLKCALTNFSYSSFGKEPWTVCSLGFVRSAIPISISSFRFGCAARRVYPAAYLVCGIGKRLYFESALERISSCARAILALWCNWLTRRPLKAKSPGSSPGNATKPHPIRFNGATEVAEYASFTGFRRP